MIHAFFILQNIHCFKREMLIKLVCLFKPLPSLYIHLTIKAKRADFAILTLYSIQLLSKEINEHLLTNQIKNPVAQVV